MSKKSDNLDDVFKEPSTVEFWNNLRKLKPEYKKESGAKKLRAYQTEAFQIAKASIESQKTTVLEMATGTGKTLVNKAVILDWLKTNKTKALYIAHSEDLLAGFMGEFSGTELHQPCKYPEIQEQIVVVTIQTLMSWMRTNRREFNKFLSMFGLVCFDETHHYPDVNGEGAWAKTAKAICKQCKMFGVTATAFRSDKEELIGGDPVYSYSIDQGVRDGYLASVAGLVVFTKVTPTSAKWKKGVLRLKFKNAALKERARIIHKNLRNTAIELNREMLQTVLFVASVDEARLLKKEFDTLGGLGGIAVVTGEDVSEDRQVIYSNFNAGKVNVIISVNVVTEGVNLPNCEVVGIARSTSSRGLYMQMIGRGTRIPTGNSKKKYLLVLDFVDNIKKHHAREIMTAARMKTGKPGFGSGLVYDRNCVTDGLIEHVSVETMMMYGEDPDGKKEQLLEMARKGMEKPAKISKLGRNLQSYISPSSGSYDPSFIKKIKKLAPSWFANAKNPDKKLKELFQMLKRKDPKPKRGTLLSRIQYYRRTNQKFKILSDKIWNTQKRSPDQNMEQLLEMARNGEPRPNSHKTKLGALLVKYTQSSDPMFKKEFTKKIKKLAPSWFRK